MMKMKVMGGDEEEHRNQNPQGDPENYNWDGDWDWDGDLNDEDESDGHDGEDEEEHREQNPNLNLQGDEQDGQDEEEHRERERDEQEQNPNLNLQGDGQDEEEHRVRHQVRRGSGSQSDDGYVRLSYQLRKVENAVNRRKRMITITRKKAFADMRDFAILAKLSSLLRLLLSELPIQRYPLVLTQVEERINLEIRESFGKDVLKHNVPASAVSALLGSLFPEIVRGFKLKTDAGACYISKVNIRSSGKADKFKHLENLIADLDSFQLQKEELDRKLEAMRRR